MSNKVYEDMEDFFKKNFDELAKTKTIKEFIWKIGELLNNPDSILTVCYQNKIPVFCPGIADSGIGLMIWGRQAEGNKFDLPVFEDMKEIISIAWDSKKNGVIYIGGGLPKNFIQQSMQFSKGASYGVQISTNMPQFGGSSGAELKEGISWGKMNEKANFVDVYCDATIALPLIYAAVKDKV
jgi:deoxyhypusine synthase